MRKIVSMFLVVFIVLVVFGVSTSRDGFRLNRAIAMEQRVGDATVQKPAAPVFPQIPPNDPYYKYQWNLDNYGEVYVSGKTKIISNYGIQAELAWKAGASGDGIKVAIIDSGVAYEDWTDSVTGFAYKKMSDFGGTSFDTENARDFTADPASTKFYHATDDIGNGTSVAYWIAAGTNNNNNLCGIAYKATILPIKINKYGESMQTDLYRSRMIQAITWAADKGAKVIFLKGGYSTDYDDIHTAVQYAADKGALIISSVGWTTDLNTYGVTPGTKMYPSAYPECMGVGGTNFNGTLSNYVNYGDFISVYAPHGNFTQDDLNKDGQVDQVPVISFYPYVYNATTQIWEYSFNQTFVYRYPGNTDAPQAQAVAVAAMVFQKHPTWTPAQVKAALINSAKTIGKDPFNNDIKLLNAYGAVTYTP